VLKGGLLPGRSYLLRGGPGTGKTILGLHYLRAGVEVGETALYLSFEESPETIVDNAERLGFDVSDVEFLDLTPNGELFDDSRPYSLFEPDEGSTVLFTTQPTAAAPDDELQFLSDGAIELDFGPKGRTVQVTKLRGSDFESGVHTVRISDSGMAVYPVLVPGEPAASLHVVRSIRADRDRELLVEWLQSRDDLTVSTTDPEGLLSVPFDCCIIDRTALTAVGDRLLERVERERPLSLPCLLFSATESANGTAVPRALTGRGSRPPRDGPPDRVDRVRRPRPRSRRRDRRD